MKRPRPASRKISVLAGSFERRTASSGRSGTGGLAGAAGSGAVREQPVAPMSAAAATTAKTAPRRRGDIERIMGASFVPPF
jgi:hypothetical protein